MDVRNSVVKSVFETPIEYVLEKYPKLDRKCKSPSVKVISNPNSVLDVDSLEQLDLRMISDQTRKWILECNSPIVFSHGDFQSQNRIVATERDLTGQPVSD